MEATKNRIIKRGDEYDHLFSRAPGKDHSVKKNATLTDTVVLIPKVVQKTIDQTALIAQRVLKGKTLYETCKNIWHFVYKHIQYKKDETGTEQIRSPRRSWHDRRTGVDCDCYSVLISSILANLNIPHTLRITKYRTDNFQHIYPIVPHNGKYITIDCVTDQFNYEVPFSEKKDYPMELQFLDGIDGDGMGELGKIIKRNMAKAKKPAAPKPKMALPVKPSRPLPVKKAVTVPHKMTNIKTDSSSSPATPAPRPAPPAVKPKKKGFFKKALNVVNKINPATVLLRNGILAAMKLNIKNVAARLRWSYLAPEQAAAKNIDPVKFQKLLANRQKLESIFYGAGGKTDNLKKAILGGKGNKDKAVNGLGMVPMLPWADYINEYTPLHQVLGQEIYFSENIEGMEGFRGFGELGEPISLASVGAAMGVIAGIVASLKEIGDIFKKKQEGSKDFDEDKTDAPENNVTVPASNTPLPVPPVATAPILPVITPSPIVEEKSPANIVTTQESAIIKPTESFAPPAPVQNAIVPVDDEYSDTISPRSTPIVAPANAPDNSGAGADTEKESFWDKNKKWIKPVAIGVGGLTLIAFGYKMLSGSKNQNRASPAPQSLSGIPAKKKNHYRKPKSKPKPKSKNKPKNKSKPPRKKAVVLL